MKICVRPYRRMVLVTSSLFAVMLVWGCGGGNKEPGPGITATPPTLVGSASCVNQCHAATVDISGDQIAAVWAATTHTTVQGVQCEDCHGGGSEHWGVGPIPYPIPQSPQCNTCHNMTGFDSTIHANPIPYNGSNASTFTGPDMFFFQPNATNTGQAENLGQPEFFPDGKTPVTYAQHIQECSVCHMPNQRFVYNGVGALVEPDPNNMPTPAPSCPGCHDAHQTQQMVTVPQRSTSVGYPIFRTYVVNPTGEQDFAPDNTTGDKNPTGSSTRVAGIIYQPNGAVQPNGSVDQTKVVGNNNELSVERMCAACHTEGKYLYSQQTTHQSNVYPQWLNAIHSQRTDTPFATFSANPNYYQPGSGPGHQTSYPFDMALNAAGATANLTRNAGNNNFLCFKCHNGLGSLDWQSDQQGTANASVIFGDEPVICVTCHGFHSNPTGTTDLVRVPTVMTDYYPSAGVNITIHGNVFLDNTPIPPVTTTGNGTICIFCHQGRESGLTLYASKLAPGTTITGSFFNPHYLGTAAMLWGHNAYEYTGQAYSVNAPHQGANCPTCHMDNATGDNQTAGHTWKPNVVTCNAASCHGGFNPMPAKPGTSSPNVNIYRASFDTNNYTGDANGASLSIAVSIQTLEQKLIALLQTKGCYYNDLAYPYFFTDATYTTSFTAWTPAIYKAAFNISFVVKGLPSSSISAVTIPNASAAVHNFQYCIQLLLDSYADVNGAPLAGAFRPVGTRPAVVYGPGQ